MRESVLLFVALWAFGAECVAQEAAQENEPASPQISGREVVTISQSAWTGGRVVEHILAEILESHLDVDVQWASSQAEGGDPDIIGQIWMPTMREFWSEFIAPGSRETIRVNAAPYFAREGLYIPGYVQEQYGIRHVEDLADPKIAALFDHDGDGRGELWPGDPSWAASLAIHRLKARSYGYEPHFEFLSLGVDDFRKFFHENYDARRPVLYYGWEPSDLEIAHDVRLLEEPPFNGYAKPRWPGDSLFVPDGCWDFVDPQEDPEWEQKSKVRCAFPPSEVWIGFRADLAERLPRVGRFLERLEVTELHVQSWIRLVQSFQMTPAEMAEQWVRENAVLIDDWIEGPTTLRIAELNWDTGEAVGALVRVLLEERLGLRLQEVPHQHSFIDRIGPNGFLDLYADLWLPESFRSWKRLVAPGSLETIRVNRKPYKGREGFYIDGEADGLRRVADLKKPEIVRLFDSDGDGKGEVWYGESDWPVAWMHQIKARSYGFADVFEALDLSYEELEERLLEARAADKKILLYHWDPGMLTQKYRLHLLEEPVFDGYAHPRWDGDPLYLEDGCWNYLDPADDPRWRELSEIRCATPETESYIAWNAELDQKAPRAAQTLRRMKLRAADVDAILLDMTKGRSARDAARTWLKANSETVDSWLAD